MNDLEKKFTTAMYDLYYKPAEEYGKFFSRYKQSLDRHGAVETARRLLRSGSGREGLSGLFKMGGFIAIDRYSVEALILKAPWRGLFSDQELETARQRLANFKSDPS